MKIQYIGTNTYQEQPLTKHFALWQPGQKSEITDQARIDLLIARDDFTSVDQEQQSFPSLSEFNAAGGAGSYGDGPVYINGAQHFLENSNFLLNNTIELTRGNNVSVSYNNPVVSIKSEYFLLSADKDNLAVELIGV